MFVSTFQCIIHNILKRAKYVGKLIIKAAWRTCRFNSCVGSVYRNNPVPSAVERDRSPCEDLMVHFYTSHSLV